jgi:hypothetical protein
MLPCKTEVWGYETLKLVQEGAGNILEVIGIGKDFLN